MLFASLQGDSCGDIQRKKQIKREIFALGKGVNGFHPFSGARGRHPSKMSGDSRFVTDIPRKTRAGRDECEVRELRRPAMKSQP